MSKPILLWFLWLLFLNLTSINNNFAWSLCLEHQKSLLLKLKSSLTVKTSKWQRLATWNQSSDCCEWSGIHCNDSTGHVIGLDLSGESITGRIDNSSTLFNLQSLESLNLANNNFINSPIPSAFGKLSNLTYLNLSDSGFSGQIPMEISRLIELQILDLSTTSYLGFSPLVLKTPRLSMLIQNLTKIKELYLDGVAVSTNGSELGKALSSSLPNLQVLSLSNCNITGEIDSSLEKLQSLSEIILSQNDLATSVPELFANFRNLTVLKLSSCGLTGTFPERIFNIPTLRILDLSYNSLLRGNLIEFPGNGSLQNLILSFTKFSGQLPNSIGNLKQLYTLNLQNCSFSGVTPSSMVELTQLVHLDLSMNNFSGPIPSFSEAKNLTYLHLSNNDLTGTIWTTNWTSLSNLVSLDLSSNFLNGRIPMDLFSMQSLQILQLYQNEFTGDLSKFPSKPSLILYTLDLSNNKLQGRFPKSLFGMKALRILKLSCNGFNDTVKLNMIKEFKNLTSLDLSYNNLSVDANDSIAYASSFPQLSTLKLGSCKLHVFPGFLRNQSRLEFLDLSDNQIPGTLPRWVWTIGKGGLSYLNLSRNLLFDLERPVPETPGLRLLDINSNQLSGEIPILQSSPVYLDYSNNNFTSMSPKIGKSLSYALYFSISRNQVSGFIPTTLCNASYLQVLDLSNNSLVGTIPDCVMNMTRTLLVLNLRSNSLNGTIPTSFPEGCSISTIDMSNNILEGQLPSSLQKCKTLEVLNVESNEIQDTFPVWLMNLSKLRVLVLRSNRFHGSISCPPSNKGGSMLQLIDLASNNFTGEIRPQCFQRLSALMGGANNSQLTPTGLQYSVLKLDDIYYQDTVAVISKGLEITLQKYLSLFTCIDLSKNQFNGSIPAVIGDLTELIVLNMSHNALSGLIPPSIGNLSKLESLDLSYNNLQGNIPRELASLNFLAVLNLSYNKLAGMIPTGTQLQSFDNSSYIGNIGLCGSPLQYCSMKNASGTSTGDSTLKRKSSLTASGLNWEFILMGSGFGTGAAVVIAPFMFWKRGKKWYDGQLKKLASDIVLCLGIEIDYSIWDLDEGRVGVEEGIGHQLFDINGYDDETEDEQEEYGRFCVYCTKLDIERKRVIHNLKCSCHGSPSISPSSSKSSSM